MVGVERPGHAVVDDPAGGTPGSSQLDRSALPRLAPEREAGTGERSGQREAATVLAEDLQASIPRDIGEVGWTGEHIWSAGEGLGLSVARHLARTGEREHHELLVPALELMHPTRLELEYA
jgi:hypothetical protein